MPAKRIIACLDVKDGRVVKGVRFVNLRDAGDPAGLAAAYSEAGIDEVVFLDITASAEKRGLIVETVERTARQVFIPLAVGGGVREILLTSMDCDGTKAGFDCELTRAVSRAVGIPVIASGGGGELAHFYDVLTAGEADAALAASVFHYGEIPVPDLKRYLHER